MRRRVDGAGLSGAIETRLQDFLEVDPADMRFARVTAILLDPSCSGSGIVSAPGRIHDVEGAREGLTGENGREKGEGKGMGTREVGSDESRVDKLAAFQLRGLLKAMSFPQVGVLLCLRARGSLCVTGGTGFLKTSACGRAAFLDPREWTSPRQMTAIRCPRSFPRYHPQLLKRPCIIPVLNI